MAKKKNYHNLPIFHISSLEIKEIKALKIPLVIKYMLGIIIFLIGGWIAVYLHSVYDGGDPILSIKTALLFVIISLPVFLILEIFMNVFAKITGFWLYSPKARGGYGYEEKVEMYQLKSNVLATIVVTFLVASSIVIIISPL